MTECLERSVLRKGIKILDGMQVVQLLVGEGKIRGALAVNTLHMSGKNLGFTLFCCSNVILATGGPAGVYLTSVYPESQTGMTGMALEAGAQGANLQEWQYGLASIQFRWNVSGTYQQVLPCYIAVDREGNEREFLPEYFDTPQQALDMVFLKGYQWPFDVSKAGASSMVDLIVYHEIFDKGNRVFMDFRTEPSGLEKGFEALGEETRRYLSRSGALLPLPIKRLEKMNPKAIELYRSHGIDLYREPLEIAVCAQHNNGGLAVDENWQTCVEGLYAAGEVAGTFGVYRPGGSALNSTQVGSMRAAEHIACSKEERAPEQAAFLAAAAAAEPLLRQVMAVYERRGERSGIMEQRLEAQKAMSSFGAFIRNPEEMRTLSETLERTLNRFFEDAQIASAQDLPHLLKNRDLLVTQLALLNAMQEAAFAVGSRGSAFVTSPDGAEVGGKLSMFRYLEGTGAHREDILLTEKTETGFCSRFVPVRPFPPSDDWFETVWNEFNERTRRVYR